MPAICDMVRFWLVLLLSLAGLAAANANANAEVFGVWSTEDGKSRVELKPCDDSICGTIVWLLEPNDDAGQPKRDIRNKNESLRDRPIIGLRLLGGFSPDGKDQWDDGEIYNPEDGKTYSSKVELQDGNTLKVKGCVLFFCKSQYWTRVE